MLLLVAGVAVALPVPGQDAMRLAQNALPTLDDAVFLESRVDRRSVFLGEGIRLTLTFGSLSFRGIRVQQYHQSRRIPLPDLEGFFTGRLEEEEGEVTRGDFTYRTTVYRLPLFPTRAGELHIGAWRWQGTARGHTAQGAQSKTVDMQTDPITIQVKPLPPAPPEFTGAVGEFEIAATLKSKALKKGVPTTYTVSIAGTGNPQSLRGPTLPDQAWRRLGEPETESFIPVAETGNTLEMRFTYELMPMQDGTFQLGPPSLTYFSPSKAEYVRISGPEIPVNVEAPEQEERLVVVGGGGFENVEGLIVMDDGRLPLAGMAGEFAARGDWRTPITWLALLPVFLFAAVVVLAYLSGWRYAAVAPLPAFALRLQAALDGSAPVDGLREAVLREVARQSGVNVYGMSVPEVERTLFERGWGGAAREVAVILKRCDSARYGGQALESEELAELAFRAGTTLGQRVGGRAV